MFNIIFKFVFRRICLMSFILFSSLFTNENAFSQQDWVKDNLVVTYYNKDKSIIFDFLLYKYKFALGQYGFLVCCNFEYSKDGKNYIPLMTAKTIKYEDNDRTCLNLVDKKLGEHIELLNCMKPAHGTSWPNDGRDLKVEVNIMKMQCKDGLKDVEIKRSFLNVKWYLPSYLSCVNYIKITGIWKSCKFLPGDRFTEVYTLDNHKSNLKTMINTPSVMKTDIIDNVTVSKVAAAINVTGAQPGENIKVYIVSGLEVKSVVANDDVVNIMHPKNQIYVVKAGQASYKIVL